MAMLVTMRVGPVDWTKFKAAIDAGRNKPAKGRHYSRVYRGQSDPSMVLVVEEWDSHDDMHVYQDAVGEEFNRIGGTEGMEWQTMIWELAESM